MNRYRQSYHIALYHKISVKWTPVKTYLFGYSIWGAVDRSLNQWLWNYLNMHQQFADSIIFEIIANQRQIKFLNARTKKSTIKTFFAIKVCDIGTGTTHLPRKNLRLFRLVSAIFYQIFIFHQMLALQKLWKMFFLILSKKLYLFSSYSNFCIFVFPVCFPCQPLF